MDKRDIDKLTHVVIVEVNGLQCTQCYGPYDEAGAKIVADLINQEPDTLATPTPMVLYRPAIHKRN